MANNQDLGGGTSSAKFTNSDPSVLQSEISQSVPDLEVSLKALEPRFSTILEVSSQWAIVESHLNSFSWSNIDVWTKRKIGKLTKARFRRTTQYNAGVPADIIDISDGSTLFRATDSIAQSVWMPQYPPGAGEGEGDNQSQAGSERLINNEGKQLGLSASQYNHFHQDPSAAKLAAEAQKTEDLKAEKEKRRHILKTVSGYVKRGELVALMGSSGAGKTSLLNVLTCKASSSLEIRGTVFVNGLKTGPKELNAISAYVQQGDVLPGALTVKEHLVFCAHLKMDPSSTKKDRLNRVDEVIEQFGLTKCMNTCIGIPGRIKGISGGEKRRVSVAAEFLWNPDLIFCDEPLSGLDSFTAEELISVMRMLTKELGKTIICTIHQPSSKVFRMFDRVILMSEGRNAFTGSIKDAYIFFSQVGYVCPKFANPSDFFIETLTITPDKVNDGSRARVATICDAFNASPFYEDIIEHLNAPVVHDAEYEKKIEKAKNLPKYRVGWFGQFAALAWRDAISIWHDRGVLWTRFFMAVGLAIVIGVTIFEVPIKKGENIKEGPVQSIAAAVFLLMVGCSILNIFAVFNTFHECLTLFLREHHNHMYRVDAFFLANQLTDIPALVIFPLLYYVVNYSFMQLTWDFHDFVKTGWVLLLIAQCGAGFGYFVSCMTPNIHMALAIGPGLLMPLMLVSGFFIPHTEMPAFFEYTSYLSWFSWGNQALLPIHMDVGYVYGPTCRPPPVPDQFVQKCQTGLEFIKDVYAFEPKNFWPATAVLGCFATGLRLGAFLALFIKARK